MKKFFKNLLAFVAGCTAYVVGFTVVGYFLGLIIGFFIDIAVWLPPGVSKQDTITNIYAIVSNSLSYAAFAALSTGPLANICFLIFLIVVALVYLALCFYYGAYSLIWYSVISFIICGLCVREEYKSFKSNSFASVINANEEAQNASEEAIDIEEKISKPAKPKKTLMAYILVVVLAVTSIFFAYRCSSYAKELDEYVNTNTELLLETIELTESNTALLEEIIDMNEQLCYLDIDKAVYHTYGNLCMGISEIQAAHPDDYLVYCVSVDFASKILQMNQCSVCKTSIPTFYN